MRKNVQYPTDFPGDMSSHLFYANVRDGLPYDLVMPKPPSVSMPYGDRFENLPKRNEIFIIEIPADHIVARFSPKEFPKEEGAIVEDMLDEWQGKIEETLDQGISLKKKLIRLNEDKLISPLLFSKAMQAVGNAVRVTRRTLARWQLFSYRAPLFSEAKRFQLQESEEGNVMSTIERMEKLILNIRKSIQNKL